MEPPSETTIVLVITVTEEVGCACARQAQRSRTRNIQTRPPQDGSIAATFKCASCTTGDIAVFMTRGADGLVTPLPGLNGPAFEVLAATIHTILSSRVTYGVTFAVPNEPTRAPADVIPTMDELVTSINVCARERSSLARTHSTEPGFVPLQARLNITSDATVFPVTRAPLTPNETLAAVRAARGQQQRSGASAAAGGGGEDGEGAPQPRRQRARHV
jgi:hypothetical protein